MKECHGAYAFGDDDLAADRLGLVAEGFAPSMRAFLEEFGIKDADVALDLGCGPGHTTRLLAETLHPRRVIGLDSSASFMALARRLHGHCGLRFLECDVTRSPLPVAPADMIYVRFLLAHLTEPETALFAWAQQLRPTGRLLVEEVEAIETGEPVLASYLQLVTGMLVARGQELAVGQRLALFCGGGDLVPQASRVVEVEPTTGEAARMFWLNFQAWRDSYFAGRVDTATLRQLEAELRRLIDADDRGRIRWQLRQLVFPGRPGLGEIT